MVVGNVIRGPSIVEASAAATSIQHRDQCTIVFGCCGDSRIILSASAIGTVDEQQQSGRHHDRGGWCVRDLVNDDLEDAGPQLV
jgi:hypothetical protein